MIAEKSANGGRLEYLLGGLSNYNPYRLLTVSECSKLSGVSPQTILKLRFGFYDETYNPEAKEHTLEEAGKILELSRERVRQIESRAKRVARNQIKVGLNRHQFDESDFATFL